MSFSEDVASQQNEAEMVPEAPRNFLSPDDQSGNSDVLCFCFVEVESRRTSSAVLAAQCSPTCSISLILLPYSLLLLSSCITEARAVFLVQLLATGSRSTMNPADHDEVVSQFCAMTRARPDDVGILSQMQKSR